MIWAAIILSTGALLYSIWCARECGRYVKIAEAAAERSEAAAQRSAESLQKIKDLR